MALPRFSPRDLVKGAKELAEGGKDLVEGGVNAVGDFVEDRVKSVDDAFDAAMDKLERGWNCLASNFREYEGTLFAVVDGAKLACNMTKILGRLTVESSTAPVIAGRPAATVTDHVVGTNLFPFEGVCMATGRKCDPSPIPDWIPPAKVKASVGLLPSSAHLRCNRGGVLSIKDPGQANVNVTIDGVPLAPPGASVEDNVNLARLMLALPPETRLTWFFNMVRPGGLWDYKRLGIHYENFGNYNYGATGAALGIPRQVLRRMAGLVQELNPGSESKPEWGNPTDVCGDSAFGDDPRDQEMVDEGVDHHDR